MANRQTSVLYVEDELYIQKVARLILETLSSFTVEICSFGDEALQRAPGAGDVIPELFDPIPQSGRIQNIGVHRYG